MGKNKSKRKPIKARAKAGPSQAERADKHHLYEQAVQCVEAEVDFVAQTFEDLRQRKARYLREDFCGTANTSCEWIRRGRGNYATGIDLDPDVLAWGREHHLSALTPAQQERIVLVNDDVMTASTPLQDVVLAMNFSYWMFKERRLLRRYFKRVLDSLVEDGVMFLDCYGGYDAFRVLKEKTRHKQFTYVWDQAAYNPVNGDLRCHIHFRFADGSRLTKAFTYDWRLWTLPEIKEILAEAGFSDVVVYWQGWDEDEETGSGEFSPVDSADADAGWIAYIAAVK